MTARGDGRGPLLWTTGTTAQHQKRGSFFHADRGSRLDAYLQPRARKSAADPQAGASDPAPTVSEAAPEQAEQTAVPTRKPRARKSASEAKEAAKKHLGG